MGQASGYQYRKLEVHLHPLGQSQRDPPGALSLRHLHPNSRPHPRRRSGGYSNHPWWDLCRHASHAKIHADSIRMGSLYEILAAQIKLFNRFSCRIRSGYSIKKCIFLPLQFSVAGSASSIIYIDRPIAFKHNSDRAFGAYQPLKPLGHGDMNNCAHPFQTTFLLNHVVS